MIDKLLCIIFLIVFLTILIIFKISLYEGVYKYHRLIQDKSLYDENNIDLLMLGICVLSNCYRTNINKFAPKCFQHNQLIEIKNDHDECIGFYMKHKDKHIISISGTTTLSDVYISMNTELIHVMEGRFHKGYFDYALTILPQIINIIQTYSIQTLYLTGHSMGGAVISILSYLISYNFQTINIHVYTFGVPKYTTKTMNQYFKSKQINIIHYLNEADPVIYKPLIEDLTRVGKCIYYKVDTGNDNINHSMKAYKECILRTPPEKSKLKKRLHTCGELLSRIFLDILG